jgi:hypothetical protein
MRHEIGFPPKGDEFFFKLKPHQQSKSVEYVLADGQSFGDRILIRGHVVVFGQLCGIPIQIPSTRRCSHADSKGVFALFKTHKDYF